MLSTISISLDRILESVYAHSAAHHLQEPSTRLFGENEAPLLRRVARDVIAGDLFALLPAVKSTNLVDAPDSDIITADIELPETEPLSTFRIGLESCVVAGVLAHLCGSAGSEHTDLYLMTHSNALASLIRRCTACPACRARIHPSA